MDTPRGYRVDIPETAYTRVQALQNRCVDARLAGRLDRDLLLLVEHPPVFTVGRNGGRENLTAAEAFLSERGIPVVPSERGGNITYHGPGQLVGYPILHLDHRRLSIQDYVSRLEAVLVDAAAAWGVKAGRSPLNPGVWVGGAKLGSIGLCRRHGVVFHGFALNANNDLTPFSWIHPCGLKGVAMTSLARERGAPVDMAALRSTVAEAFSSAFGTRLAGLPVDDLEAAVAGAVA